jgi:hypothetical protein
MDMHKEDSGRRDISTGKRLYWVLTTYKVFSQEAAPEQGPGDPRDASASGKRRLPREDGGMSYASKASSKEKQR